MTIRVHKMMSVIYMHACSHCNNHRIAFSSKKKSQDSLSTNYITEDHQQDLTLPINVVLHTLHILLLFIPSIIYSFKLQNNEVYTISLRWQYSTNRKGTTYSVWLLLLIIVREIFLRLSEELTRFWEGLLLKGAS